MRILIPSHTFLPQSPYGAELYARYIARGLKESGCQVQLLFTEKRDDVIVREFEGLTCTVLPRPLADVRTLEGRNVLAESLFSELLSTFKPDVVHFNHLLQLSTRLPELASRSGARTVFTLHDYWLRCPAVKLYDYWGNRCISATKFKCASCCRNRYSQLAWSEQYEPPLATASATRSLVKELYFQMFERPSAWLRLRRRDRELQRMAVFIDRFIAPVNFLRDKIAEWGIPKEKITVCDYGTECLPYSARVSEPQDQKLRFGFLGATIALKGIDVLLNAFAELPEAELVIYGSTDRELVERHSAALNAPNITLAGRIDDVQKAKVLPQLDALIVPSIWYENSPLVIHEAFQAGVPVICSNIGGMAELVTDGVDGLHFEVGNVDSLRSVIRRCVARPDLLQQLKTNIRPPKSMYTHVVDELIPLYDSLVAKRLIRSEGLRS